MEKKLQHNIYPPLPLEEWEETKKTLHLYIQIIGKIRLCLFPKTNHWWHAPLYLSTRGITTRPIPFRDMIFEIEFDFLHHVLSIQTSNGDNELIQLNGISIAQFYRSVVFKLAQLGISVDIKAVPYNLSNKEPFANNYSEVMYNEKYVSQFWNVLVRVGSVFEKFRAEYTGKSTPVHLFWHHLDLVVTRFSGKRAPNKEWPSNVEREAYSHEVISFGFWAGDDVVREPAFYGYVYPEPEGLMDYPLQPDAAVWNSAPGYAMAFLPYEAVQQSDDPDQAIKSFLNSVYHAGCSSARWDAREFELEV